MRTISSHVQDWLERNPFTSDQLQAGLINHSSLARKIKQDIEASVGEKISVEAATIALNRLGKKLSSETKSIDYPSLIGDVSVQTGLSILIFDKKPKLETIANTMNEDYVIVTQGIKHSSIIVKTDKIDAILAKNAAVIDQTDNLVGMTIQLRAGHETTPGVIAHILGVIAAKGIDLREVVSTYSELTIFVDKSNAKNAVAALI